MRARRSDEAGWVLLEAVLLSCLVLVMAAALGIHARAALLREHAAARMEAAFVARAQFSQMEADLDMGRMPLQTADSIALNDRIYEVEAAVSHAEDFYDVHLHLSWQILGRREAADYVRRMRRHERPGL